VKTMTRGAAAWSYELVVLLEIDESNYVIVTIVGGGGGGRLNTSGAE
jgi:hypothetical protein